MQLNYFNLYQMIHSVTMLVIFFFSMNLRETMTFAKILIQKESKHHAKMYVIEK